MRTPLSRAPAGSYHHVRFGVDVAKTGMRDFPWELSGPDPDGRGVALARTLADARAFLSEIEEHIDASEDALLGIHRYLFPERYADVPMYEWHAGTIEDVADMLERSLAGHPDANLTP